MPSGLLQYSTFGGTSLCLFDDSFETSVDFKTLYEAAEIDGANAWQKFKNITLPELYFVIGSVALLRGIWNFYKFDEVYLMSKFAGTLPIYIYEKAFLGVPEQGVAAAIATILFVGMMALIGFYVKKVLKW